MSRIPLNTNVDFSPKTAAIWFWSVVLFFAGLWILLPTIFHTGYRINDVIEQQIIAREWVLAIRKHPMLSAWMLEILNLLTNRCFAAPFIASQLCVIVTVWSVWQLGRNVLSEKLALIGALTVLPSYFFTYHSLVYNHNMTLIAFWALSVYFVFKAYQTNQLFYWIISGISLGLAFHTKYPIAFLVAAILTFMFTRSEGRKCWCHIGPYLTTMIAFLVFLPHIIWVFQNDFATINFVVKKAGHFQTHFIYHLLSPLYFMFLQSEHLLTIFVMLFPVIGLVWKWRLKPIENILEKHCEKYLFYCFIIPLLFYLSYAGIRKNDLTPAYGVHLWMFFGTWTLLRFQRKELSNIFPRTMFFFVTIEMVMVLFLLIPIFFMNHINYEKKFFPMQELGTKCEQIWNSRFQSPCRYLSGDWRLSGCAAWAMKDRPSVLLYINEIDNCTNITAGTWASD
jgi:4-amino-4-deoxy-L-arabinose transferase-like glycosyltransferase